MGSAIQDLRSSCFPEPFPPTILRQLVRLLERVAMDEVCDRLSGHGTVLSYQQDGHTFIKISVGDGEFEDANEPKGAGCTNVCTNASGYSCILCEEATPCIYVDANEHYNAFVKDKFMEELGPCVVCGKTDRTVLQADHLHDDGNIDRAQGGLSGRPLHANFIKMGFTLTTLYSRCVRLTKEGRAVSRTPLG